MPWWLYYLLFIGLKQVASLGQKEYVKQIRRIRLSDDGEQECCPCPKFSNFDKTLEDSLDSSTALRSVDSRPSASYAVPTVIQNVVPYVMVPQPKDDPKSYLHPEVGLVSSVLHTLKEATDEDYKDALERDAAKNPDSDDDSNSNESVVNELTNARKIVTVLLDPPEDSDVLDDLGAEESHAHETRCVIPHIGESKPIFQKEKSPLFIEPDENNVFAASNIKESIDEIIGNIPKIKLEKTPLIHKLFPKTQAIFKDLVPPLSNKIVSDYPLSTSRSSLIPELLLEKNVRPNFKPKCSDDGSLINDSETGSSNINEAIEIVSSPPPKDLDIFSVSPLKKLFPLKTMIDRSSSSSDQAITDRSRMENVRNGEKTLLQQKIPTALNFPKDTLIDQIKANNEKLANFFRGALNIKPNKEETKMKVKVTLLPITEIEENDCAVDSLQSESFDKDDSDIGISQNPTDDNSPLEIKHFSPNFNFESDEDAVDAAESINNDVIDTQNNMKRLLKNSSNGDKTNDKCNKLRDKFPLNMDNINSFTRDDISESNESTQQTVDNLSSKEKDVEKDYIQNMDESEFNDEMSEDPGNPLTCTTKFKNNDVSNKKKGNKEDDLTISATTLSENKYVLKADSYLNNPNIESLCENYYKTKLVPKDTDVSAEASEPLVNYVPFKSYPTFSEIVDNFKYKNVLPKSLIIQPESLLPKSADTDILDMLSGNSLFGDLKLPTFDEVRARLADFFNTPSLPTIEIPQMRSLESAPRLKISDPLIGSLKPSRSDGLNFNIFRLQPLKLRSAGPNFDGINLNTFKTKLPLIKPFQIKPINLQSILTNKDNLLGASVTYNGKKNVANKDKLNWPLLKNKNDKTNFQVQKQTMYLPKPKLKPITSQKSVNLKIMGDARQLQNNNYPTFKHTIQPPNVPDNGNSFVRLLSQHKLQEPNLFRNSINIKTKSNDQSLLKNNGNLQEYDEKTKADIIKALVNAKIHKSLKSNKRRGETLTDNLTNQSTKLFSKTPIPRSSSKVDKILEARPITFYRKESNLLPNTKLKNSYKINPDIKPTQEHIPNFVTRGRKTISKSVPQPIKLATKFRIPVTKTFKSLKNANPVLRKSKKFSLSTLNPSNGRTFTKDLLGSADTQTFVNVLPNKTPEGNILGSSYFSRSQFDDYSDETDSRSISDNDKEMGNDNSTEESSILSRMSQLVKDKGANSVLPNILENSNSESSNCDNSDDARYINSEEEIEQQEVMPKSLLDERLNKIRETLSSSLATFKKKSSLKNVDNEASETNDDVLNSELISQIDPESEDEETMSDETITPGKSDLPTSSLLAKLKESLKPKTTTELTKIDEDLLSDVISSPSENVPMAMCRNCGSMPDNVSYKCKLVCSKE